jgi:hypothetical protein
MPIIECNATAAKENVSKVERTIRMVKEQVRGLLAIQPLKHIPNRVKIDFVYFIMLWLNAFPARIGCFLEVLATRAIGEMENGL